MIAPQRVIQFRLLERLGDERDRLTPLQRFACCRCNIGTDNDRTYPEGLVDLARRLGATSTMCKTQVHQHDVGSVSCRAGNSSFLGGGQPTDLMPASRLVQLRNCCRGRLVLLLARAAAAAL
jgi:hypothetical protein